MASATPSLESFCAAENGRYHICRLKNRYGNARLPKVHTVDMRQEVKQGNLSPISRFLLFGGINYPNLQTKIASCG